MDVVEPMPTTRAGARAKREGHVGHIAHPRTSSTLFFHPSGCREVGVPFVEMSTWVDSRGAFEQAAQWFSVVVPEARRRFEEPGLGEWSIRDLIGHTSRALLTVELYLAIPAAAAEVCSPIQYFTSILANGGNPEAIAQRGREAGIALGDDPVASVKAVTERVLEVVRKTPDDNLVTTPVGGMRLVDYLPTRTFELTVHTCDLARALGLALDVPKLSATQSLAIVGGLAIEAGTVGSLILSTTGRERLPMGFSVV